MKKFRKTIKKDVVVVVVNCTAATINEAGEFKSLLNDNIERSYKKLVIDIRKCEHIDSTFLGVIVFTLKNIAASGGDVRIVKSDSIVSSLMLKLGTLSVFNVYDSVQEAVQSYSSADVLNYYQPAYS